MYLINLRESHKMKASKKPLKINVGDAVNIFEEVLKRKHGKVGTVLKTIRVKDDVIKGAVVHIFCEKNRKRNHQQTTSETVSIGNITRERK